MTMKTSRITSLLMICITVVAGSAQDKPDAKAQAEAAGQTQATQSSGQVPKAALAFGLEDGTPVKLRLTRTISSAEATVGEKADFEVLEDIKVGEVVVIPRGGMAWGTVTEAQPKRRMGRAGKLNVNIDAVRLASGEKVALRAVKNVKGGNRAGLMTGMMVATGIVFFPAAPVFLFMKGKDITIPQGTEITAYISADIPLDPTKFVPHPANNTSEASSAAASPSGQPLIRSGELVTSTVVVKSTPDGAEITVNEE